jgi:hypothetical protein
MAEQVAVDFTLGSLKQQLKEATLEAQELSQKFGVTSKEAIAAAKRAAEIKDEIKGVNEAIDALHPEDKFNSIVNVASGITGGFAAAQGAMALFGTESEEVEQTLLKVQAALALSQGINSILGLKGGIENLSIALKGSATYASIAAAAQKIYNFVVGTEGTASLKLFRAALFSIGIGIIIAAIGLLIANWENLTKWVKANSDKIKEAAIFYAKFLNPIGLTITAIQELGKRFQFVQNIIDFVKEKFGALSGAVIKFLEDINVLDTAEEDAAQAQAERAEERVKQFDKISKQREREIALAKAQGASEAELRDMEKALLEERLQNYQDFADAKIKAGEELTDDEIDQLDELRNSLAIANANDARLDKEEADKKIKEEADKQKKLAEERKKAAEDRKKKAEEEAKRIAEIEKQLQEERIKAITDSKDRQRAELELEFNEKIAAIKGQTEQEIALRKQLEINKQNALKDLNAKFRQEDAQKSLEDTKRRFEDAEAAVEAQLIQAEENSKEAFDLERKLENIRFNEAMMTENLSSAEKEKLRAEHKKRLKEIDDKADAEELRVQQEIGNSKISIAESTVKSLSAIGDLFIGNAKKNEAFQKKLAVVQLGIDTAKSISATIAGATAAAASTGPSAPFVLASYIASGIATVLGAFVQAKKILGDSGNSGSPQLSNTGNNAPPTFNSTDSPTTQLGGKEKPEFVVKAEVVETEMTDSQKRVKSLEDKASF